MTVFCYKKIDPAIRLGERLRRQREALGLDISSASIHTHLAAKYITAIESGHFLELPKARGYRLAYIREYATSLGLSTLDCVDQFSREDGLEGTKQILPPRSIKWSPFVSITVFIRTFLMAGAALAFAGYLAWQVHGILVPPQLSVYTPSDGSIINQPTTIVEGQTEKEAQLTVNGQPVMVNDQGQFEATIDLSQGLNTIAIVATKKHGKTTTVTRHIVVRNSLTQVSLK